MYNDQTQMTKQDVPAIISACDRIERALTMSHDLQSGIESKIDFLYSTGENDAKTGSNPSSDPRTFHDKLLKLADMADALANRIERARKNFDRAI